MKSTKRRTHLTIREHRLLTVLLVVILVTMVGVYFTFRSRGEPLPAVVSSTTAVQSGNASVTQFVIEGYSNGTATTATGGSGSKQSKTTQAPPSCNPAYAPALTPLDVSGGANGLTKQIDSPLYYQIYGYTIDQIKDEAKKCHPVTTEGGDAFLASTAYLINWRFDGLITDEGICKAANIRVGVRVRTIYPSWNSTSQATAAVATSWRTFIQNLTTHEQGHQDLDINYAAGLLGDLQNQTADDCDQLADKATSTAQHKLAALNNANQDFDLRTQHGATQGAVLK